jgi:hypothetical protein
MNGTTSKTQRGHMWFSFINEMTADIYRSAREDFKGQVELLMLIHRYRNTGWMLQIGQRDRMCRNTNK